MLSLYHLVPNNMVGSELVPLSQLRTSAPAIYEQEVKKYDDHPARSVLPKRPIHLLHYLQEDVLHFSPIHPHLMYNGLKSVFPNGNQGAPFFEIPIERFRGLPSVYFDMNRIENYNFGESDPNELFEIFTPETYRSLERLPPEALDFYNQWKDRGESWAPAMGRIPHVMVRGCVNTSGCRIINWECLSRMPIE